MDEAHYTRLYTKSEIEHHIDRIADRILADYRGERPLFVALLRGANPFASKLMFALARMDPTFQPEIDYMTVSTYGHDHTAKEPVIITDLAPTTTLDGRPVVILDDVIDQGITAAFVSKNLISRGAASVAIAVLASKAVPNRTIHATYVGVEAGDRWLVGMGLDDAKNGHEHYRWLEELWEIKR